MVPRAVLTHLWLDDCFDDGKLVPVLYYHQPITIDLSLKPCEGAVIGISNYSGRERTYIRLVFLIFKRLVLSVTTATNMLSTINVISRFT